MSRNGSHQLPEQVVFVVQGGGALGAYQVGVYRAMHEAGLEPDWVIGTSIGAINGAIIAGNALERRLDRLHELWEKVERSEQLSIAQMIPGYNPWANLITLTHGIAGFFTPAIGAWLWPHAPLGTDRAAFYTRAPLRQTLTQL
jgi:NTE family protein